MTQEAELTLNIRQNTTASNAKFENPASDSSANTSKHGIKFHMNVLMGGSRRGDRGSDIPRSPHAALKITSGISLNIS